MPIGWARIVLDNKIICPFHGASFNITDGTLEGGPATNSLPTFEVIQKGGEHYVKVPEVIPNSTPVKMAKRDSNNKKRYVVVGNGVSGLTCAETLR